MTEGSCSSSCHALLAGSSAWPVPASRRRVERGQFIATAGAGLAVGLLSGWAEAAPAGAIETVETAVPTGVLMGLGLGTPRPPSDLWAITDVEVACWAAADLRDAARTSHMFALQLLECQATAHTLDAEVRAFRTGTARHRVARFLLPSVPVPWCPEALLRTLRRADLARLLALSPETVSRTLGAVAREGILDLSGPHLVRHPRRLRALLGRDEVPHHAALPPPRGGSPGSPRGPRG